jgi:hypothetical protein
MRLAAVVCALAAFFTGAAVAAEKPRYFVLTDIGNEPDDQMSLVRLLTYSNEIDIEALVATTSTWQKDKASPEIIGHVIDAYEKARPNLAKHADGWPTAESLRARVKAGQPAYGLAATGPGKQSAGAEFLIDVAMRDDPRPVWVGVWGGANTLAQALQDARRTLDAAMLERLIGKLRVYSISDQDDAGPWIRREFPTLFYIVKPSPPNGEEYGTATWTGISGDEFYRNGEGADFTPVSHDWIDRHIRSKGPLGAAYPRHEFIMEGDTPAFLGLTNNGLNSWERPSFGGWGGRYVLRQPYGETRPIWTQGGDAFQRVTSADRVKGVDGRVHVSDQATIWRWRGACQNDFAARMDWSVKERAAANHPPTPVVNGVAGTDTIRIAVTVGDRLPLDAAGTRDPDDDRLTYVWFHYAEAGALDDTPLAAIEVVDGTKSRAIVKALSTCRPHWLGQPECKGSGVAHVILAVTDSGSPPLTRYRRVILEVRPRG